MIFQLYTRDGTLIAVSMQEGVIRTYPELNGVEVVQSKL